MAELRHGINFSSCSGCSTYLADEAATILIAKEVQTSWPPGPFLLPHLIRSICETGGAAAAGDRNEEATAAVREESRRWRAWLYLGKYLKGATTETQPTGLSLSPIAAFAPLLFFIDERNFKTKHTFQMALSRRNYPAE